MKKKDVLTKPYSESLLKRLVDPEYAAGYLNAVIEEGDPAALLVALRYVVEARGLSHIAASAKLGQESLYKTLAKKANPKLSNLTALFDALGFQLQVAVKPQKVNT